MKIHFEAKIIVDAKSQVEADDVLFSELQKRHLQGSIPFFGWGNKAQEVIIDLSSPVTPQ